MADTHSSFLQTVQKKVFEIQPANCTPQGGRRKKGSSKKTRTKPTIGGTGEFCAPVYYEFISDPQKTMIVKWTKYPPIYDPAKPIDIPSNNIVFQVVPSPARPLHRQNQQQYFDPPSSPPSTQLMDLPMDALAIIAKHIEPTPGASPQDIQRLALTCRTFATLLQGKTTVFDAAFFKMTFVTFLNSAHLEEESGGVVPTVVMKGGEPDPFHIKIGFHISFNELLHELNMNVLGIQGEERYSTRNVKDYNDVEIRVTDMMVNRKQYPYGEIVKQFKNTEVASASEQASDFIFERYFNDKATRMTQLYFEDLNYYVDMDAYDKLVPSLDFLEDHFKIDQNALTTLGEYKHHRDALKPNLENMKWPGNMSSLLEFYFHLTDPEAKKETRLDERLAKIQVFLDMLNDFEKNGTPVLTGFKLVCKISDLVQARKQQSTPIDHNWENQSLLKLNDMLRTRKPPYKLPYKTVEEHRQVFNAKKNPITNREAYAKPDGTVFREYEFWKSEFETAKEERQNMVSKLRLLQETVTNLVKKRKSDGGGTKAAIFVTVLGRRRKVTKMGRKSMVVYQGKHISLTEARALERAS